MTATASGFGAFERKMRADGMTKVPIDQFRHLYQTWKADEDSSIPESEVTAVTAKELPDVGDVHDTIDRDKAMDAFAHTAFLKLNGGLGTSMGLNGPKSLLPVRRHKARQMRFIDIILGQVVTARARQGVPLPITFMNSFRTSAESLHAIEHNTYFRGFSQEGVPLEILQHKEPKIDVKTGRPASFPADPELEWCPPGHGDVYSTIWESGYLDALDEAGMKYLFISNSDNLGARPSSTLAGYFASSGSPFMIELCRKTPADRKGGQIVRSKETGQLMLREISQVPDEDRKAALNMRRHPFFNTNNIWVRVDALRDLLEAGDGVLGLPIIVNHKTVDPADPDSAPVIQLETAMGAAIGLFPGATCIEVGRARFLPVKTTNDLFLMRSDRFHLTDAFEMEDGNYIFPDINLDERYYRTIDDFDARFSYGVPSIAAANTVTIDGDWYFGQDVCLYGDAHLSDPQAPSYVPNGRFVGPAGIEPDQWV